MTMLALIQAAAEYGGASSAVADVPQSSGLHDMLAWASDHRVLLLGALALLLLLYLFGSARRT